jgi:hypothetical protein
MAIEKRFEQQYCPDHDTVHWVQVVGRTGNVICHGLDMAAPTKDTAVSYAKHRLKGINVREKVRKSPKTNFRRERLVIAQPEPTPGRRCVAEIGMPTPAGYASVKVFEDATAERFYEWYWKAGGIPQKVNSVDLGTGEPKDLNAFVRFFRKQDDARLVVHDRPVYNKLLAQAGEQLAGSSI